MYSISHIKLLSCYNSKWTRIILEGRNVYVHTFDGNITSLLECIKKGPQFSVKSQVGVEIASVGFLGGKNPHISERTEEIYRITLTYYLQNFQNYI